MSWKKTQKDVWKWCKTTKQLSGNTETGLPCYPPHSDSLALVSQEAVPYIKPFARKWPAIYWLCIQLAFWAFEVGILKPYLARSVWQQVVASNPNSGVLQTEVHTHEPGQLTWWTTDNKLPVQGNGSRTFQVPSHWGNERSGSEWHQGLLLQVAVSKPSTLPHFWRVKMTAAQISQFPEYFNEKSVNNDCWKQVKCWKERALLEKEI